MQQSQNVIANPSWLKYVLRVLIIFTLLAAGGFCALNAQEEYTEGSKLNTNLGFTVDVPLNPTARFVSYGWGFVAGAGYNFNRRNAFVGEVMWNRYYATDTALAPLRAVAQAGGLNGYADLFALTGNYRYELRGDKGGAYFIGGGGAYFRYTSLTKNIASVSGTACVPSWLWWGFACTNGFVDVNQVLSSSTVAALGVNGGFGVTMRVGDPPYRLYAESRYHYVPHQNINSQFVTVTFGVRF